MGRTTEPGLLIGDRPLVTHPYQAAKAAFVCCRCGDVGLALASEDAQRRRDGASSVPVSSSRALAQVGPLNRSEGGEARQEMGRQGCIPGREPSRARATRPRPPADRIVRPAFVLQTLVSAEPRPASPDFLGDRIAAAFSALDVRKTRCGCTLAEPRTGRPVARIRPLPDTDRFGLFDWSSARERWKTFEPLGPMRLELDDVADIVQNDPLFRIKGTGLLAALFG